MIRRGHEDMVFSKAEVIEIVQARLDEIFEGVRKEIKIAKYERRLPEGVVLVGGGANLKDIALFAREALEASIKIGKPRGLGGVADAIEMPEYAAAVGLAVIAAKETGQQVISAKTKKKSKSGDKKSGLFSKIFKKF